jgi:hypothetical protein
MSTLGENHPDTLTAMNNLAFFYHQQVQHDKVSPFPVAYTAQALVHGMFRKEDVRIIR